MPFNLYVAASSKFVVTGVWRSNSCKLPKFAFIGCLTSPVSLDPIEFEIACHHERHWLYRGIYPFLWRIGLWLLSFILEARPCKIIVDLNRQ